MIKTIYVCVRVDNKLMEVEKGRDLGVETLTYSESKDDALRFMEIVSARDAYGHSWNYDTEGDPFFDIEQAREDAEEAGLETFDLPSTRFIVWNNELETDDVQLDRPTSVVSSISLFASKSEDPDRSLLRTYKLCKTNPTVDSFVNATTEGDLEMVRQVTGTNKLS
jgi:hypothetical protein